ncbi:MAG: DUF2339 domain-containing protein [Rubrivivax sp.]|nr:DUF2339 domain-containing protein [Rubrivivax sp.]
MPVIATLLGALLGGAWGESFFGAAVGAALAWLALRVRQQGAALAELKKALLERHADAAGAMPPDAATEAARQQGSGHGAEHDPRQPAAAAAAVLHPADAVRASPRAPTGPLQPASAAAHAQAAAASADTTAATTAATAAAMGDPGAMGSQPVMPSQASLAVPGAQVIRASAAAATTRPSSAAVHRDWLAPVKGWLFGGNTIVKLGVAILFVGLAFLAKFASEHVHVPVEARLAMVAAAAIVLLVFGWRLRHRRAGYAQVLQGAAVAVLFLTLFVAFRYFQLVAALPVFVLMVAVAALAAALAVLQDAKALAVIGALGGFATPLLVSTGSGNYIALFGYYLVLDLGIAAVAWFKTWRALNLIGFAATFGVGALWGLFDYRPQHYGPSQAFLVTFFLLFNAILLLPARRQAPGGVFAAGGAADAAAATPGRAAQWVNGSLLFGLPTITFALQLGMVRHWPFGSALAALGLAAFYVALAIWMRRRDELRVTFEASLAIAVVFLTLVIPFALDARSTAGAWALEGAGLVWLGWRQSRRLPRVFGYALLMLAAPTLLLAFNRHGAPQAIFNAYLFNGLMAVAGSLLAAHAVRRGVQAGRAMTGEALAEPALVGWALLWALGTAALQIDQFVLSSHAAAAWLVAGSAIVLGSVALATRLDWPMAAWPAALHALLLGLAALDGLAWLRAPWAAGGAWAWPVALGAHLAVLRWAARHWSPVAVQHAVHVAGVLVLALLGALGGRAITQPWGDAASAWPWLGWLAAPALLLTLLLRGGVVRRWPLAAAPGAYQLAAAGVLAAGLWLWTLAANGFSNGAARPLPHVPLLNPLDLGVGVALFGACQWLRSAPARQALGAVPWLAPAVLGAGGFAWLNAIVIRGFHHYGGVPYRLEAWARSLPVHAGITLLWAGTSLALMWLAARRGQRAPWLAGAVLLGAVVLKLMLVDLSGTGTVARIVSFIGVGVLMLVIGYVAPLPARAVAKEVGDGPA